MCFFLIALFHFYKGVEISVKKIDKLHLLTQDKLTLNDVDSGWCITYYLRFNVNSVKVVHKSLRIFQKFCNSKTIFYDMTKNI